MRSSFFENATSPNVFHTDTVPESPVGSQPLAQKGCRLFRVVTFQELNVRSVSLKADDPNAHSVIYEECVPVLESTAYSPTGTALSGSRFALESK